MDIGLFTNKINKYIMYNISELEKPQMQKRIDTYYGNDGTSKVSLTEPNSARPTDG